jgi:hypothetical protein
LPFLSRSIYKLFKPIVFFDLKISFRVTGPLLVFIIGIFVLLDIAGIDLSRGANSIFYAGTSSASSEILSDRSNTTATTNQRSHSDLIRICSTFHEILSEDVAFSCDYSMLYYIGQCELYSDLVRQNETGASMNNTIDLSFCSDPRLEEYIKEHDLTNAPRSPTLIPNGGIPMA